jgi:hydroxyacylglutathione hydrolase
MQHLKSSSLSTLGKYCYRIFAVSLFQDNYSFIIEGWSKGNSKELVLVDPAQPTVILNLLEKYFKGHYVSHVLYTHKHWDHAGGNQELYE